MTVIVKIGRRVPRSMRSRVIHKMKGLLGFQENIWIMLKMSFNMMRKKWQNKSLEGKGKIDVIAIDNHKEFEDTFHFLEWVTITIQGDEEGEADEYKDAMKMYDSLKQVLKKVPDKDDAKLDQVFKTKFLDENKLKEAYTKGYGSEKDKNVSKILLEMGIITHIEWIKDFKGRVPTIDL